MPPAAGKLLEGGEVDKMLGRGYNRDMEAIRVINEIRWLAARTGRVVSTKCLHGKSLSELMGILHEWMFLGGATFHP